MEKVLIFVSDVFAGVGSGKSSLAFAIALPNGPVVYQEVKVDPARLTESRGDSPFNELGGALYVGRHAQASKMLFKKPCASNMRGAATSIMVIRFFAAMALKKFLLCGARAEIRVPSQPGLREFKM